MSRRALLPALAATLACAALLSGCLTHRVQPVLSKAVVEARASAGAKASACTAGDLASLSPMDVGFAFDDAAITEAAQSRLAAAARWLSCNPKTEVVILPSADSHGDAAHLQDLAQRRAQAVQDRLRALGATGAVIHVLGRGAADPVTAPHLVINAIGRGW